MNRETVDELLLRIKAQFKELNSLTIETSVIQTQIDGIFEELDKISEQREDVELILEHARLLNKNTESINESIQGDDGDTIVNETKELLTKSEGEGLYDEDIPRLEGILTHLENGVRLKRQLRTELIDLLDEARHVKDESTPKA